MTASFFSPVTDVALSSSLLCHDPNSPTHACCSDGALLLGGFGGPLNLTVSSVEYLGPEEDHPSPGRKHRHCTPDRLIDEPCNNRCGKKWICLVAGCSCLGPALKQINMSV